MLVAGGGVWVYYTPQSTHRNVYITIMSTCTFANYYIFVARSAVLCIHVQTACAYVCLHVI